MALALSDAGRLNQAYLLFGEIDLKETETEDGKCCLSKLRRERSVLS